MPRRRSPWLAAALSVLPVAACPPAPSPSPPDATRSDGDALTAGEAAVPARPAAHRFIVLGFDGLDPRLVDELGSALPNLQRLRQEGTWTTLRTTNPPQSPVAWATFATGLGPGEHGIFDFVARDPRSYRPSVGTTETWDATYSPDGSILRPAGGKNLRRGPSFWALASREGHRSEALFVPFAWPPESMPHGAHVSGLGLPDLRGTNSTATVWSTGFGDRPPDAGGVRAVALTLVGGAATTTIEGPIAADGRRATVPVRIAVVPDGAGFAARVLVGTEEHRLRPGDWSPFLRLKFTVSSTSQVAGSARFQLVEAGPDRLTLYMDPVGAHPEAPHLPLADPPSHLSTLMADGGPWKTVGWEEDTSTLNAELLPDDLFIDECHRIMEQRLTQTRAAWNRRPDLLVSVWTGPDRLSHLFWRDRDHQHPRHDARLAATRTVLADVYRRVDTIVGSFVADLPPDAHLVVLSDHGFGGFRWGLHVNRWLHKEGYLQFREGTGPVPRPFLQDVDWARTRAYSVGTGQIYLNLRGRERDGTVLPSDAEGLLAEIDTRLRALHGPDGEAVLRRTEPGDRIHAGAARASAPDLQLSFAPGWQTSWETRLGAAPEGLFAPNDRLWSGDHAASDPADCPGILGVWPKVQLASDPGIEDLAPTILRGLGLEPPKSMVGKALFSP